MEQEIETKRPKPRQQQTQDRPMIDLGKRRKR